MLTHLPSSPRACRARVPRPAPRAKRMIQRIVDAHRLFTVYHARMARRAQHLPDFHEFFVVCRFTTYRHRFARAAPAPRAKRNDDSKNRGRASPVNEFFPHKVGVGFAVDNIPDKIINVRKIINVTSHCPNQYSLDYPRFITFKLETANRDFQNLTVIAKSHIFSTLILFSPHPPSSRSLDLLFLFSFAAHLRLTPSLFIASTHLHSSSPLQSLSKQ